jgi:hypothetical protein
VSLDIIYENPASVGYQPVLHMVRLAAEMFGARLIPLPMERTGLARKVGALLPSPRGDGAGLVVCTWPGALLALLRVDGWRRRYGRIAAWVFDSFWIDSIPRIFQSTRHFDHVFVTELEDREEWERRMRVPVEWLPWGSDVLRLGSDTAERPVDLLRVGRQPPAWDDDAASELACARAGLRFQGRPDRREDPTEGERDLMAAFAKTKFTLSFSNTVNPLHYTHPTRSYITGRWTDALAAGATVAGVPPDSVPVRQLLWPEALLDLGTIERDAGLAVVRRAVELWTPERARINHLNALERLDWRRRFERIAAALELDAPALREETLELDRRVEALRSPVLAARN